MCLPLIEGGEHNVFYDVLLAHQVLRVATAAKVRHLDVNVIHPTYIEKKLTDNLKKGLLSPHSGQTVIEGNSWALAIPFLCRVPTMPSLYFCTDQTTLDTKKVANPM